MIDEPFILTEKKSSKIFAFADGHPNLDTTVANLEHTVRDPERPVNIVPALAKHSLLSGGKISGAGYVSIYDGNEVKNLTTALKI